MAKVDKHVWKVHNVGLGAKSHWVPTCSVEAWLVGTGMWLSQDTGASSGHISGGCQGGI